MHPNTTLPRRTRIISFNSRIFDKADQKMSTHHSELCGTVSALQTYEHYIIGSPLPMYLYCDHKPIFYLWGRKGQISHRFFRCQVIITKFQNLKIYWRPGSNLAFPDILSRKVIIDECQHQLLRHKKLPRDIQFFFDDQGQQIAYKIDQEDTAADTCNDLYPIDCQQGKDQKILRLHNDGENFSLHSISTALATSSVHLAADYIRMGKAINQFRRFCRPHFPVSLSSSESSSGTYGSISVTETAGTEEPRLSSHAELTVHKNCDADEDEDAHICENNANDHYHYR